MNTIRASVIAVLVALAVSPVLATAAITLESAPPVVVKTEPAAGSIDVSPDLTEIRVTYSKAMQDGSWSWSTWGEENFPETTGRPRYLADGRTCVLPVKLVPGKFYAIWLNSDRFKNFQDTGGRPAVPYLLTFVTAGEAAASEPPPNSLLAWLAEAGIDLDAVSLEEAPNTQIIIEDLDAEGRVRFRSVIRSRVHEHAGPQRHLRFINSDHVNLERMVDADGNRIPFTQVHEGRIYRYSAELPNPVPPGGILIFGSEGSQDGHVTRDASGLFSYRFTHSPESSVPTRRVEVHRLPPGAELIRHSPNTSRREREGRMEVVLDDIISPGGNSTVTYRYRLVATNEKVSADRVAVEDLALRMLAAIRDREDDVLKELSVDAVAGWRDGLPHFAFEMRERFQQMTGEPFSMRVEESLADGGLAVVKCVGPETLRGIYVVLFFVKTEDGWRNWNLRNSPPGTPLSDHLRQTRPPEAARGARLEVQAPWH